MANSQCFCVLLLSFTYTLLQCCDSETEQKKVLHLLVLLPYFNEDPVLNPSWSEGDNIVPALQLAQDDVNAHPNILQDYRLELIQAQAGCQLVAKTIVNFVKEVYHTPRRRITGIIGPGCSSSSIALAPITNKPAVALVMLHGSGSPALADRKKYPYHLGTLGSTGNFVSAIQYLLQNWERVAILYDVSRLFYRDTVKKLIEKLKNTTRVEYIAPVYFNFLPLSVIREHLLRIVLVMCPAQLSRHLICLSYHRNMTYDNYQWVYMAHRENVLVSHVEFIYENEKITCSESEMADALSNQILLVYSLNSSNMVRLEPLNITYQDYLEKYENYIKKYNARGNVIGRKSTYSIWASYFYDSVWAWALVLDNLTKTNPEMFKVNGRTLHGDVMYANLTMKQFFNTRFEGVSGSISYDRSTGFTPRTVNLIQIAGDGEEKMKGKLLVRISSNDTRDIISNPIQISDSFCKEYVRENKHLARFFTSVVILLFVTTVSFHILTCMNVKQPTIKAVTPKLLHLSYVGLYIMLLGIFTYTVYPAVPLDLEWSGTFCQIFWNWTIPIGFTLSMGPVAMRTWRLYRIFFHYLNPGPFITNTALTSAVLVMLMVDILLAVIWRSLDSIQTKMLVDKYFQSELGVKILRVRAVCTSSMYSLWIILLIIDKLLLLVFVTILVFLTRKISNLSFTTNSLRVLIYVFSFITVLGFTLHFSLTSKFHPNYNFTALSITMISLIIVFLACVMVPPLLPIFKNYYKQLKNNC